MSVAEVLDESYRVAWGDLVYIRENLPEVLVSSLVGPLLYLLAFGFGLGGSMSQGSEGYIAYIIPGIIALTTLSATFSTVSMKILIQRLFYMSFDELLLCPVRISSIVIGKSLAGMVKAVMSCAVILMVGCVISPQVASDPLTLVYVMVAVAVAGFAFSMFGMLAGMLTNKTQRLTLFSSIVIVPMTFLCGTLFDVSTLPSVASWIVYALPLTHVSAIMRGLMLETGMPLDSVAILMIYLVAFFVACWWLIKTNRCRGRPTQKRPPRGYHSSLEYCSSSTGSSHVVPPFSEGTDTARWVNQLSLAAPCQCLTPAGMFTTSPGWSSCAGSPHAWYHPRPAVTSRIWPPPLWMCQLLRQPGSKVTLPIPTPSVVSIFR